MAADWTVKRVSGIVYFVAPGVEAFRAKKGMVFEKGFTLGTRAGGRVLIARGEETISVGPNTTFAISKYQSNNSKTTLLQRKGKVTVDVAKRSRPHFFVETPFLAAVVKGTRFDVQVGSGRTRVSVERGIVGVQDFSSGDRADLTRGQNASSSRSGSQGLSVGGPTKPSISKGAKRSPMVGLLDNVAEVDPETANNASGNNGKGLFGGLFGSNGNSNGNGNGNSNGNSNGNGNGNSNGNSNGNGNGNSNGNGNGNSNGNGNGNSNGNGNGNSNGNGNGNSNGNGNGNSNGNGNGNSNGNGNGNSNGNGNGNSNGNSNGN
ncbi:FecR domain-containing protein [Roseibium album]|uniref:FecR domain-containing protein n=1 Tax=Roseibium album TaxID=311410 RepID=UPI003BAE7425